MSQQCFIVFFLSTSSGAMLRLYSFKLKPIVYLRILYLHLNMSQMFPSTQNSHSYADMYTGALISDIIPHLSFYLPRLTASHNNVSFLCHWV